MLLRSRVNKLPEFWHSGIIIFEQQSFGTSNNATEKAERKQGEDDGYIPDTLAC